MKKGKYRFKNNNQTVSIFPVSDIHYGTEFCNEEFFEYMLHKFDKTRGFKIMYLLGDLMDCATKRLGNSAYKQLYTPQEQLDYIVEKFKPFKRHIRGVVPGNHELRYKKEFDLDITKILANELNVPYFNTINDYLNINGKDYHIFGVHGTKTSQQLHLMHGQVQRQTDSMIANLILYGHCHYLSHLSTVKEINNEYFRTHYVLTGHYLKYKGSYAEDKLLKPNLEGFAKIDVDKNLRTNVQLFNIDECCVGK